MQLAARLAGWLRLRATPPAARRLALLLYGFPPNVGATGTAALLDVPATLDALLARLRREGYDLGPEAEHARGETLIAALATLTAEAATARGARGLDAVLEAATRGDGATAARVDNSTGGLGGARVVAAAVDGPTLRGWLGGELAGRLEAQWGDLRGYRGLGTQQDGGLVCAGLQVRGPAACWLLLRRPSCPSCRSCPLHKPAARRSSATSSWACSRCSASRATRCALCSSAT